MAAHPEPDPIAEEAERVLRENPQLRTYLEEFEREYPKGKASILEHEEVRRRLKELGVPLED